jgi:uncharacterized DUF497 family protein
VNATPEKKAKRAKKRAEKAARKPLVLYEFDWSANRTEHAGVNEAMIEAAFYDRLAVFIPASSRSRSGEAYRDDGRQQFVASAGPSGPILHIVFVMARGKIKPFHARLAAERELKLYRGK